MYRTLLVCRHAKAAAGDDDFDRPLEPRGERDAAAAGRWLSGQGFGIDRALCSLALRARRTWELAGTELVDAEAGAVETVHDDRIYEATAGELIAVINELPDSVGTAALIGHNPGLEDVVSVLTGRPCRLKTAAVAVLTGPGDWTAAEPGWAQLREITEPRG